MSSYDGATYVPKKGDRVNVTLRGAEVVKVKEEHSLGTHFEVIGNDTGGARSFYVRKGGGTVSVEKVAEPLPTTPGSVLRWPTGSVYVVTRGGNLFSLRSHKVLGARVTDYDQATAQIEVLFDAGKAS